MLESIELSRKVSKADYKPAKERLELKLVALQRQAKAMGIPVIIVFEGWGASGKGTMINELILPLDPRGFNVYSIRPPNQEEAMRPFLWRFWTRMPTRGRIAIFDRSWYREALTGLVDGNVSAVELLKVYEDIKSFERQLADDGNVIVKFFLHISKQEQKKRFKKLQKNSATAWRVTSDDLTQQKNHDKYIAAVEDILARTDSEFAPWTIVEAHDRRFAVLKIFSAVVSALEDRIAEVKKAEDRTFQTITTTLPETLHASILNSVDLSLKLNRDEYRKQLKQKQKRMRELQHEIYVCRIPVVIVYEGSDAAGKGGNIRRLARNMDPRGYEVVPIAAPNDIEKAHHYLWRFWTKIPKAGHITIFDRSWYGRVLVERIEGFCSEAEWKRAYHEINEMEQHLTNFGTVLLKFWLQIDCQEQFRRFQERERVPHKQWKITEEDWRNREKWDAYKLATEEMLFRTSTPCAPWTVIESNCKRYARIKALDTVIKAIERRLKE